MPPRPRKRVRRRRPTQQVSSSSSSSSSSGSDSNTDSEQGVEAIVLAPNQDEETKDAKGESFSSTSSSSLSSSDDMESLKAADSDEGDVSSSKSQAIKNSSSETSDSDTDQSKAPAKRGRLAKKRRKLKPAADHTPDAHSVATRRSPSPVPASPPPPLTDAHFELDLSIPYLDHPPTFALPFNLSSSSKHDERLNTVTAELAESEADFRAWYMSTVVDRFENELDQVRQDLEKSRGTKPQTKFELLLAGLASGANVFEELHHPVESLPINKKGGSTLQSSKQSEKDSIMEILKMRKSSEDAVDSTRPGETTSTEDVEMHT